MQVTEVDAAQFQKSLSWQVHALLVLRYTSMHALYH